MPIRRMCGLQHSHDSSIASCMLNKSLAPFCLTPPCRRAHCARRILIVTCSLPTSPQYPLCVDDGMRPENRTFHNLYKVPTIDLRPHYLSDIRVHNLDRACSPLLPSWGRAPRTLICARLPIHDYQRYSLRLMVLSFFFPNH